MTTPTFNPPMSPSPGMTSKPEVKVIRTDFGDGYSQATKDGMNHIRANLDMTWDVLTQAERDEIEAFLVIQGGTTPFLYQPPGSPAPIKWTCQDWSITSITANLYSINASFRQAFTNA